VKRDDRLQPPVVLGPPVRVRFADVDEPGTEAGIDRWLRSIGAELVKRPSTLDSPSTPEEVRRP